MKPSVLFILAAIVAGLCGCDHTESDWEKATQSNTTAAYRDFLAKHPQGTHVDEANSRIDDLDWKEALTKDTIEAHEAYSSAHPQGAHAVEAANALAAKRDDRDWAAAKASSTVEAVDGYLKTYASGKHAREAATLREVLREDRAWAAAKSANTQVALQDYLAQYPSGRYVTAAKDTIEELAWGAAQASNTTESHSSYLASYPSGRHAQQAAEAIDAIDWDSAKATSTLSAWKGYIAKHKDGQFVGTARQLIEKTEWDTAVTQAVRSGSTALLRQYYRSHPDSNRFTVVEADIKAGISGQFGGGAGGPFGGFVIRVESFPEPMIVDKEGLEVTATVSGHPECTQKMTPEDALALKLITYRDLGMSAGGESTFEMGGMKQTRKTPPRAVVMVGELPVRKKVKIVFCSAGQADDARSKNRIVDIKE